MRAPAKLAITAGGMAAQSDAPAGRAHPRYRVNAQAIWTADGVEVRWPVWTLSWGGAGLVAKAHAFGVGTRLHIRLVQPGWDLGCAHVEVVYTTGKRVGL